MNAGGGAAIGGMICGALFGLLIGTLIGAVFLRAACWLYNKMAGGPGSASSVPEPPFGKAMLIALAVAAVNFVVSFVVGFVVGGGAAAAGAKQQGAVLLAQLVSIPISFLVMAGMLTPLLPTTFPRALLITLLYFVIAVVVIGIAMVIIIAIFGVAILGFGGR